MSDHADMSGPITSERILKDAYDNKDREIVRPSQSIQDLDELRSYQLTKRKEYEQQLNKNRLNLSQWVRYAKWEINHNHDYARARSIFERALDVNVQHIPFWTHYIQFELAHKNINHARNLLDRAVTTLPRVNKLWFVYVHTEETLRNYQGVRRVFERWLQWKPDQSVWQSYINFEIRYNEVENARNLYKRYLAIDASGAAWSKWIDFEINQSGKSGDNRVRNVFESAVDHLLSASVRNKRHDDELPSILSKWAEWEVSAGETERAREIYRLALEDPRCQGWLQKEQIERLQQSRAEFEKNHGNKTSIETSIWQSRALSYQKEVGQDPENYDAWWAYLELLEKQNETEPNLRSVFVQATSHVPQDNYKSLKWRRYIFLWIKYALWEELKVNDVEKARQVWTDCLKVVPHHQFTFAKAWIGFAQFELRVSGLTSARKVLGKAIGQSSGRGPKPRLMKYYIELEHRLGEWKRVRALYERWYELALAHNTEPDPVLLAYVEFERSLEEHHRCVALFELGLSLEKEATGDTGDELWYAYIEYLKEEMKYDDARAVYRRLVRAAPGPRAWVSFALFESSVPTAAQLEEYHASGDTEFEFSVGDEHRAATRKIFSEANLALQGNHQARLVVLEAWASYEDIHGDEQSQQRVSKLMPTLVQRHRKINGVDEEYMDYIFPQDQESVAPAVAPVSGLGQFLANAKQWASQNT